MNGAILLAHFSAFSHTSLPFTFFLSPLFGGGHVRVSVTTVAVADAIAVTFRNSTSEERAKDTHSEGRGTMNRENTERKWMRNRMKIGRS